MADAFLWDERARRFRGKGGRFIGKQTLQAIRDDVVDKAMERVTDLTGQYTRGEITLEAWRSGMRQQVKQVHIIEYLIGRGGRSQMTPSDWGRIGAEVRKQYAYLDRLVIDRLSDAMSDAEMAARARMYAAGATASHEEALSRAWNVSLPDHPGSGGTRCLSYCKCSWTIVERDGAIEATWNLGGSKETCPDCTRRSREWAPLRFDLETGEMIEELAA